MSDSDKIDSNKIEQKIGEVRNTNTVLRPDNYQTLYSNQVKIRLTAWDISLIFGKNVEFEPGKSGILELCEITLAPGQLKTLATSLVETIKAFEETFGEIKIDPAFTADPGRFKNITDRILENAKARKL